MSPAPDPFLNIILCLDLVGTKNAVGQLAVGLVSTCYPVSQLERDSLKPSSVLFLLH